MIEKQRAINDSLEVFRWIGGRLGMRSNDSRLSSTVDGLLLAIARINKGVFCNLLLRAIAVLLDDRHEGNIRKCENVWVVSTTDGKVRKISTKHINKKAWEYFAAFRSVNDAVYALKLVNIFKEEYVK